MKDRTLDQQCTVTRPGLSFVSSALAVELLVALLHHPQGFVLFYFLNKRFGAPAENIGKQDSHSSPLGIVPHSIRGFLSNFSNIIVTGHAYDKCTACSKYVTCINCVFKLDSGCS